MAAALPSDTQEVYDYFVNAGYTPAQSAGIVGNLIQESSLNPEITNTSSGATGIAQWLGSRLIPGLVTGNPQTDLETQLGYVVKELGTTEQQAAQELRGTTTPAAAAAAIMQYYERPGDNSLALRQNYAQEVYAAYGSSTPAQTTSILSPIGSAASDLASGVGSVFSDLASGVGSVVGGVGSTAANTAGNLGGTGIVGDLGAIGTGVGDIASALNPQTWLHNGVELIGILAGASLVVFALWRAAPGKQTFEQVQGNAEQAGRLALAAG